MEVDSGDAVPQVLCNEAMCRTRAEQRSTRCVQYKGISQLKRNKKQQQIRSNKKTKLNRVEKCEKREQKKGIK